MTRKELSTVTHRWSKSTCWSETMYIYTRLYSVHIVEFKAYADRADVAELIKKGQLYEKATGVKPKLLLVAASVRRRAKELADTVGVEVRGHVLGA